MNEERNRNDYSIEQLMREHGNAVLRTAYAYVNDRDAAEDLFQEVFIKAYYNMDKFRGDCSIKSWLIRITINVCKDYLKSAYQHKLYSVNMGKAIALFVVGTEPLEKGMKILGAHIDSPRIDIKQNPVYEDKELCLLDTHYYGGIKKYQWVTIPLAIHGEHAKEPHGRADTADRGLGTGTGTYGHVRHRRAGDGRQRA